MTLSRYLLSTGIISSAFLGFALVANQNDTLIIIDPSVPDASFFRENAARDAEVITLDPSRDGLAQIGDILADRSGIDHLQIVSHGAPGELFLGSSNVNAKTLAATSFAAWKNALSSNADIALLGCDVAAGNEGEAFVNALALLTDADVSASSDLSGGTRTAGDWDLEMFTGKHASTLAFDETALSGYAHTLNHFRYGTMSYTYVTGRQVLIKVENGWTNTHGYIPSNTPIGGIVEDAFTLDFGDGQTQSVDLRVTARDAANNDVQTEVVTQSGASYYSGIRHTYAANGRYTVYWTGGARESATGQTNSNWRSEMTVNIGNGNSSPVVAVPAVVQVQDNTIFEYSLVAIDPNGDTLNFRLGTQQEFYGNASNSNVTPPTGMTLSSTGAIRWDVRNSTLTTSAGARWQMTVMVEDLTSTGAVKSKSPIDFVFVISNNAPPRFTSYPVGTQAAPDGELFSASVSATDPNWRTGYTSPTITALNPPSTDHAVWTGSLVKASSGATYNINFTPTADMVGQTFVVIFRATNSSGATAVQPVSFLVPGDNQAPSNITLTNNSIVEHSATSSIIGTLAAVDIDPGDSHTFSLTGATLTSVFSITGDKLRIADSSAASSGTYTVTVRATDSGGLVLDKNFTVKLWLDYDADLIADYEDSLIGDRSYVTAQGVSQLTVTVGGNTASGTYTGSRTTIFMDGSTELFNFTPDYDSTTIHLANVLVKRGENSLVVNMGDELDGGITKTMYLQDNDFIALCVKDAAISSESEITAACNDVDETDFTSCIGNSAGITIGSLTCTDEGTRFRVDGLEHSGIVGTPAPDDDDDPVRASNGGSRHDIPLSVYLQRFRPDDSALHSAANGECNTNGLFGDVPSDSWYAKHVCILKSIGVISGYKDARGQMTNAYGPSNNVTYAELAKMALLASNTKANWSGKPMNASARDDWSAPYIRTMEGLKEPVYAYSLRVQDNAKRGDVIAVMLRMFNMPIKKFDKTTFKDLPMTNKNANAILTAVEMGVVSGDKTADGTLLQTIRPDAPINRAEVAKIFHLLMQYVENN